MTTGRINQVSIHESGFKAKPTKKGAVTSRIAIEWLNLLFQIKKSIFLNPKIQKKEILVRSQATSFEKPTENRQRLSASA